MTPEYAAGFFDGEGCVNITKRGKRQQVSLRVMIANTNKDILDLFQLSFGGHVRISKRHKPDWKPFIQWVATGQTAMDFLAKISPFIILKTAQIKLAFEFWQFMQLPKTERCEIKANQKPEYKGRVTLVRKPATLITEQEFKDRMHALNKKGA